jgi:hypothetical protein
MHDVQTEPLLEHLTDQVRRVRSGDAIELARARARAR